MTAPPRTIAPFLALFAIGACAKAPGIPDAGDGLLDGAAEDGARRRDSGDRPDATDGDADVPVVPPENRFLAFADSEWRRSPDGRHWETIAGPLAHTAAVLNGVVLAAGDAVYRSEDRGDSFEEVSALAIDLLVAGDERWFALSEGQVFASADGQTWDSAPEISTRLLAAGGGKVFALDTRRATLDSAFAGEWESEHQDRGWTGVTYGDGIFVASSDQGVVGLQRSDGTWRNERLCSAESAVSKPVFGDGMFVVRCEDATFASRTGELWAEVVLDAPAPVAFGDGLYITADLEFGTDGTHFENGGGDTMLGAQIVYLGEVVGDRSIDLAPCAGFVCDGFENQSPGFPPLHGWDTLSIAQGTPELPGTLAVVVDDFAYSGERSWRIDMPEGTRQGAYVGLLGEREVAGAQRLIDAPVLHGRMMIYMNAVLSRVHYASVSGAVPESNLAGPDRCLPQDAYDVDCPPWSEVGSCEAERCSSGEGPECVCHPVANFNIGGGGEARSFVNYFVNEFVADCWDNGTVTYPQDEWFCFQWSLDQEQDQARYYLNGVELEDLRMGVTAEGEDMRPVGDGCLGGLDAEWAVPRFERVRVGFDPLKPQPAATAWVDDVALGPVRIPCP